MTFEGYLALLVGVFALLDTGSPAKVYRVTPKDKVDVNSLREIQEKYDVWRHSRGAGDHSHVMVEEAERNSFLSQLKDLQLRHDVIVRDVDRHLAARSVQLQLSGEDFDLGRYHTLEEINRQLDHLVTSHPFVTKIEVAKSSEGRTIYGVKVSAGGGGQRPAVWVDGGMHAREWASPATVMYIAHQLLAQYGAEPEVTRIVDEMDLHIVPVINVDGYKYTWLNQSSREHRLWRKTRSYNPGSECRGADPNRNFDDHWAAVGTSTNPCSTIYHGLWPFSESETSGVARYMMGLSDFFLYLSFHSYSQIILTPNGFNKDVPPNFDEMMAMCDRAASAIRKLNGTDYECGSVARIIYACSGSSIDWAYYHAGARYGFGVELRDRGEHGFLLPTEQILPTAQEAYASFLVLAGQYFN